MMASQKIPAPANSLVIELERRRSMKNQSTSEAFKTAMVIAQIKLYSPNSSFETATVVMVSAISPRNTATYVRTGTTWWVMMYVQSDTAAGTEKSTQYRQSANKVRSFRLACTIPR